MKLGNIPINHKILEDSIINALSFSFIQWNWTKEQYLSLIVHTAEVQSKANLSLTTLHQQLCFIHQMLRENSQKQWRWMKHVILEKNYGMHFN